MAATQDGGREGGFGVDTTEGATEDGNGRRLSYLRSHSNPSASESVCRSAEIDFALPVLVCPHRYDGNQGWVVDDETKQHQHKIGKTVAAGRSSMLCDNSKATQNLDGGERDVTLHGPGCAKECSACCSLCHFPA